MNKLLVSIALVFFFTQCKKNIIPLEDAELIGIDLRECASPYCGGYWITINQDTLRFLNFPENSAMKEPKNESRFPIAVGIEWELPQDEDLLKIDDLIVLKQIAKK